MKRLVLAIIVVSALTMSCIVPSVHALTIDLISLVDLDRDVVNGDWQLVGNELVMQGGAAASRLSFPYYAPLEYDYTVDFTITSGSNPWDNIAQLVTHGDVPFAWSTNAGTGHYCRLEDINGHSVIGNPTLTYYPFVDGERYASTVRVRNDRVTAEINGQTLVEYATDYSDLSRNPKWEMPDQLKIGLGGYGGPITFHSAIVKEVITVEEWDAIVTESAAYYTDVVLSDRFSFDYWWEMGLEPNPGDFNLDVLFFNGENWEVFGGDTNFAGSSTEWETASFWVPNWARGMETQIRFIVRDWGVDTDPTVYLRNIHSTPIPEPATMLLLGTGLVGLAIPRIRRKS